MKNDCLHESTKKPYIRSVEAGRSLGYVPNKVGISERWILCLAYDATAGIYACTAVYV